MAVKDVKIAALQRALLDLGYDPQGIDGINGPNTRAAARNFADQVPMTAPTNVGVDWRIIWHWTAGAPGVDGHEAESYHFIISQDGTFTAGDHLPEANIPPLRPGAYAAHTLNCNSYSIGIALDAMAGAIEAPFNPGKYPITQAQISTLVKLTASLARRYNVPVSRYRMLSHAEVQPTLGITQRGKWDIAWLPLSWMTKPTNPVVVGDWLRGEVSKALRGEESEVDHHQV